MREVICVSHADDECIFAGGLALRLKCDIVCCSIPVRDPVRILKFYDACEVLGCRGIVIPYIEQPPAPLDLTFLDLERYDHIITHNEKGEYGNPHHSQLHAHIVQNYPHKLLSFFGFGIEAKDIELTQSEYQQKLVALKCYNHTNNIDGEPKWSALIKRYNLNLRKETHALA